MRRYNKFNSAKDIVKELLGRLGLDGKIKENQSAIFWPEIVGEQIAKATKIESVRDGTLNVCCKSSVWANELLLHKQDILKRIADKVGPDVIQDIRFSGKGFKKAVEKEEQAQPAKQIEDAPLTQSEVEDVEKIVSTVEDSDLAEVIRKALHTARRHNR